MKSGLLWWSLEANELAKFGQIKTPPSGLSYLLFHEVPTTDLLNLRLRLQGLSLNSSSDPLPIQLDGAQSKHLFDEAAPNNSIRGQGRLSGLPRPPNHAQPLQHSICSNHCSSREACSSWSHLIFWKRIDNQVAQVGGVTYLVVILLS
jgi:hypothetical protein